MRSLLTFALFALLCASVAASTKRSSHSEAPGTAEIPSADITDLYAFRSYESGRAGFVTFLLNVWPLQTPYGGPNYFSLSTSHFYELYIDSNSDGTEDYSFQWIFGNSLPSYTPTGSPYIYPDDFLCGQLYTANTTPSTPSSPINLGISLNISSAAPAQRIALKVAGVLLGTGGSLNYLNWQEYYFLNLITGPLQNNAVTNLTSGGSLRFDKPFDYAGQNSMGSPSTYESYASNYIHSLSLGPGIMACNASSTAGKVFVGQRQDPFYISLGRIFDYLNFIPVVNPAFSAYTIADCLTNNDLREKNVDTLALELPIQCLNAAGGIINLWAGVRQLFHSDGDSLGNTHIAGPQVSRLGNPLVNELVIGLLDKNRFSRQHPKLDAGPYGFLSFVQYPTLPEIVNIRYGAAVNSILGTAFATLAPTTPRADLVTTFLLGIPGLNQGPGGFAGEVMRLNLGVAATPVAGQNYLGVVGAFLSGNLSDLAGFPNGRRPGDDVVDIALMVMMGALCTSAFTSNGFRLCTNGTIAPVAGITLTDGSPVRPSYYQTAFPYFNTPTPGSYLESIAGNVVTDPTICYPAAQHGRCPICTQTQSTTSGGSGSTTTTGSGSQTTTGSGSQTTTTGSSETVPATTTGCPGSAAGLEGVMLWALNFLF